MMLAIACSPILRPMRDMIPLPAVSPAEFAKFVNDDTEK